MKKKNHTLAEALRKELNSACRENESNTPDYILAEYLISCLDAYEKATKQRDKWYNIKPAIVSQNGKLKEKK